MKYLAVQGYFYGGPELAINELNRNLDLDITDYVAVNFSALIDTIDAFGGIDVEITEKECVLFSFGIKRYVSR